MGFGNDEGMSSTIKNGNLGFFAGLIGFLYRDGVKVLSGYD